MNPKHKQEMMEALQMHRINHWYEYAKFRSWIDGRKFCEMSANQEPEFEWAMVQRKGWYTVVRKRPKGHVYQKAEETHA